MHEAAVHRSGAAVESGKAVRPPVQWLEPVSFNVELRTKDSVPVVDALNRERTDYVKLDTDIFDYRSAGRIARFCRNRGNRRGDRSSILRYLSSALRGVAILRSQTGVSDESSALVSSGSLEVQTFLNKRRSRTESNPPA